LRNCIPFLDEYPRESGHVSRGSLSHFSLQNGLDILDHREIG
jgi:hypothetical protein